MSDKLLRRLLEAAQSYTTTRQYYSRSQASEDLDRREQAFIAVIRETEAALREAPSSETEVTAYRRMADAAQSGASPEDVVAAQFVPSATEATRHGISEPDYLEWLADKLPALGDYAKEAAQVLRRIAAEKRTPSPARFAPPTDAEVAAYRDLFRRELDKLVKRIFWAFRQRQRKPACLDCWYALCRCRYVVPTTAATQQSAPVFGNKEKADGV